MNLVLATLKKVLFWSYERGRWQYDVLCVLILAFIFFTPNRLFDSHSPISAHNAKGRAVYISREEVGQVESRGVEQAVQEYLSRRRGRAVSVSRVEPATDSSGNLTGYVAWEE